MSCVCSLVSKYWNEIENSKSLDKFEEIYNKEFYTKYAVGGDSHMKKRLKSIYACVSSPQVDIHNVL